MGHLFHRVKKNKKTGEAKILQTWTYKFYRNGKPEYFATGETAKRKALEKGQAYEAKLKEGNSPRANKRTTYEILEEGLFQDYEQKKRKSTSRMKRSCKALVKFFGGWKASEITTDAVKDYCNVRKAAKAKGPTINRELAALKRMFHLGTMHTPPKVPLVPYIPMYKESAARKGFFEADEFLAVRDHLPAYLKGVATLAYTTGMRAEEILGVSWSRTWTSDSGCSTSKRSRSRTMTRGRSR